MPPPHSASPIDYSIDSLFDDYLRKKKSAHSLEMHEYGSLDNARSTMRANHEQGKITSAVPVNTSTMRRGVPETGTDEEFDVGHHRSTVGVYQGNSQNQGIDAAVQHFHQDHQVDSRDQATPVRNNNGGDSRVLPTHLEKVERKCPLAKGQSPVLLESANAPSKFKTDAHEQVERHSTPTREKDNNQFRSHGCTGRKENTTLVDKLADWRNRSVVNKPGWFTSTTIRYMCETTNIETKQKEATACDDLQGEDVPLKDDENESVSPSLEGEAAKAKTLLLGAALDERCAEDDFGILTGDNLILLTAPASNEFANNEVQTTNQDNLRCFPSLQSVSSESTSSHTLLLPVNNNFPGTPKTSKEETNQPNILIGETCNMKLSAEDEGDCVSSWSARIVSHSETMFQDLPLKLNLDPITEAGHAIEKQWAALSENWNSDMIEGFIGFLSKENGTTPRTSNRSKNPTSVDKKSDAAFSGFCFTDPNVSENAELTSEMAVTEYCELDESKKHTSEEQIEAHDITTVYEYTADDVFRFVCLQKEARDDGIPEKELPVEVHDISRVHGYDADDVFKFIFTEKKIGNGDTSENNLPNESVLFKVKSHDNEFGDNSDPTHEQSCEHPDVSRNSCNDEEVLRGGSWTTDWSGDAHEAGPFLNYEIADSYLDHEDPSESPTIFVISNRIATVSPLTDVCATGTAGDEFILIENKLSTQEVEQVQIHECSMHSDHRQQAREAPSSLVYSCDFNEASTDVSSSETINEKMMAKDAILNESAFDNDQAHEYSHLDRRKPGEDPSVLPDMRATDEAMNERFPIDGLSGKDCITLNTIADEAIAHEPESHDDSDSDRQEEAEASDLTPNLYGIREVLENKCASDRRSDDNALPRNTTKSSRLMSSQADDDSDMDQEQLEEAHDALKYSCHGNEALRNDFSGQGSGDDRESPSNSHLSESTFAEAESSYELSDDDSLYADHSGWFAFCQSEANTESEDYDSEAEESSLSAPKNDPRHEPHISRQKEKNQRESMSVADEESGEIIQPATQDVMRATLLHDGEAKSSSAGPLMEFSCTLRPQNPSIKPPEFDQYVDDVGKVLEEQFPILHGSRPVINTESTNVIAIGVVQPQPLPEFGCSANHCWKLLVLDVPKLVVPPLKFNLRKKLNVLEDSVRDNIKGTGKKLQHGFTLPECSLRRAAERKANTISTAQSAVLSNAVNEDKPRPEEDQQIKTNTKVVKVPSRRERDEESLLSLSSKYILKTALFNVDQRRSKQQGRWKSPQKAANE